VKVNLQTRAKVVLASTCDGAAAIQLRFSKQITDNCFVKNYY